MVLRIGAMLTAPLLAAVMGLGLAAPAMSEQKDAIVFDVELKGIRAGRLAINGVSDGARYSANGVLETTGLVGAIRKIRYEAAVYGAEGSRFTPVKYTEKADTPKRQSTFEMSYKSGTPVKVVQTPERKPRATDVAPSTQSGTIDPLTALYAVLRDVDRDQACKFNATMFDGARRTQVALSAPQQSGDGVVCAGEYRRVAGFSEKDMAEKSRMKFTLTYAPTRDGRLQVQEISTDTIYGKGRLKRR